MNRSERAARRAERQPPSVRGKIGAKQRSGKNNKAEDIPPRDWIIPDKVVVQRWGNELVAHTERTLRDAIARGDTLSGIGRDPRRGEVYIGRGIFARKDEQNPRLLVLRVKKPSDTEHHGGEFYAEYEIYMDDFEFKRLRRFAKECWPKRKKRKHK